MPRGSRRTVLAVLVVAVLAAGCGGPVAIYKELDVPDGKVLVTSAEVRTVMQSTPDKRSIPGRVVPTHIICAEPSPDVAKIVSTAVGAGGALSVQGLPSGVSPQVAAAISRANAQAMAQLTERLATIQLLRDGLHRACEAYANGAISDTTYAVMLSRFDKLMVTLLLGEVAGGAFGRPLAALGGETSSEGSAKLDTSEKRPPAPAPGGTGPATASPAGADGSGGSGTAGQPASNLQELAAKLEDATKAMAKATATAAGEIKARQVPEVARTLFDMQRKYVENINFDALEVACVSALDRDQLSAGQLGTVLQFAGQLQQYQAQLKAAPADRPPAPPAALREAADKLAGIPGDSRQTALASYCMTSILPAIQAQKGQLLRDILKRAAFERQAAAKGAEVLEELEKVKKYVEAFRTLSETMTAPRKDADKPKPATPSP